MAKKDKNKTSKLFDVNTKPNDTANWAQKMLKNATFNPSKKHIFDKLVKSYAGDVSFNSKDQWFFRLIKRYGNTDKSILLAGQKLLAIEIPDLTPEEKLDILRATTQEELYEAIGINTNFKN